MQLAAIQKALRQEQLDGWLFCGFQQRDPLGYRILGLGEGHVAKRRWFYFIPSKGQPRKLVSRVEEHKLDALPGTRRAYLSWQELHAELAQLLGGAKHIAMQYSPRNNIPYVSLVDAGTVELVRLTGVKIASSAALVQRFEAHIDAAGCRSHREAGKVVDAILQEAFRLLEQAVERGPNLTDFQLQQFILRRFEEEGLETAGAPITGANGGPSDPHFEPTREKARVFKRGDCVLVDLWAKFKRPGAIYYDITWVAYLGPEPPALYSRLFDAVRAARDGCVDFINERLAAGKTVRGWEADEAARGILAAAGFSKYVRHRTGHSIGTEVHGNGACLDNLETRDERPLVPGCLFSVEPGLYVPGKMGMRLEINVYITPENRAEVTGAVQDRIVLL